MTDLNDVPCPLQALGHSAATYARRVVKVKRTTFMLVCSDSSFKFFDQKFITIFFVVLPNHRFAIEIFATYIFENFRKK